jgi:hypothetical protein
MPDLCQSPSIMTRMEEPYNSGFAAVSEMTNTTCATSRAANARNSGKHGTSPSESHVYWRCHINARPITITPTTMRYTINTFKLLD